MSTGYISAKIWDYAQSLHLYCCSMKIFGLKRPAPATIQVMILVIFFISGACSLVYEVAWMRMLTLVFGVTAVAISTVLASFMGGLALGSYLFGRIIDTRNRPLRIYGLLELGTGIFALCMPFILSGLDDMYVHLYRQFGASLPLLNILRFLLSFTVLLIPATLMGGTLPIISRFVVKKWRNMAWSVGRLYFINTLGAAVGTVLAGFVLILFLGVREATYLAAAFNILIAFIALGLDHKLAANAVTEAPEIEPAVVETQGEAKPVYSAAQTRFVLVIFGIAGFCSLALEVLWTRSLIFILDNTTHAFTTMLSAFLLGIALGSLIMARFTDGITRPLIWLGCIICGIAVSSVISVPVFINLGAEIGGGSGFYQPDSYWQWAALRFGRSFLVMLVPTLLMGMAFPLVAKIYSRSPRVLGKSIGNVYALNTVGGVAGSLAAGFVLIPQIGVYYSVILISAVYLVLGIVLVAGEKIVSLARRSTVIAVPVFTFLLAAVLVMSPGRLMFSSNIEQQETQALLYYNEGIGSTVKVYANAFGYKYLSIDGFPVASTTPRHRDIQKALGHFPMLLTTVEKPTAAVIGLGAGGTSWAITRYDIERLDTVELVAGVVEGAKLIPEVSHQLFEEPAFNLVLADGRNYLMVTEEKYDVISIDATSPKGAGNGNLYSVELYEYCRSRLTPQGLVVQWLPFHLLSHEEMGITINSFTQVFPTASLWFSPFRNYLLLIGTMEEFTIDFEMVSSKIENPVVKAELEPIFIRDVYDFLSCYVMSGEVLDMYAGQTRLNTDNHPLLEYAPTLAYFQPVDYTRENILRIAPLRQSPAPLIVNMGPEEEAVLSNLAERFEQTPVERYWPLFFN